jgi:hypothetical protein
MLLTSKKPKKNSRMRIKKMEAIIDAIEAMLEVRTKHTDNFLCHGMNEVQ